MIVAQEQVRSWIEARLKEIVSAAASFQWLDRRVLVLAKQPFRWNLVTVVYRQVKGHGIHHIHSPRREEGSAGPVVRARTHHSRNRDLRVRGRNQLAGDLDGRLVLSYLEDHRALDPWDHLYLHDHNRLAEDSLLVPANRNRGVEGLSEQQHKDQMEVEGCLPHRGLHCRAFLRQGGVNSESQTMGNRW